MDVAIGTSERGGTFHSQGAAIAALAEEEGVFGTMRLLATETASVGNAELLEEGRIAFGFLAANWIGRAARGEAPFSRPLGLRVAAPANSGPMFFVARADRGLRGVEDVAGRRVCVGPEGSGMAQHAAAIFGVLGIAPDAFEAVHLNFADGARALAEGKVDVQFQCPIPNAAMTGLAEAADVRVLDYPPGALDRLRAAVPVYRKAAVAAGAFRGHDRHSPQIGVLNLIAAHRDTPHEAAAALAGLMWRARDALARRNPLFAGLGELFAPLREEGAAGLEFDGVALHPGAAEAYRRCGLIAR